MHPDLDNKNDRRGDGLNPLLSIHHPRVWNQLVGGNWASRAARPFSVVGARRSKGTDGMVSRKVSSKDGEGKGKKQKIAEM